MVAQQEQSEAMPWWAGSVVQRACAVVALLAVAVLIVGLSTRKIWTVDYWWQWKLGHVIAEHGLPATDVFSWTDPGLSRLELRWGYCWALAKLTDAMGHGAAVIAQVAIVLAAFTIASLTPGWRRGAPVLTAAVIALAAMACAQRFMVRPELVTYLFFIAFVAIVHRQRSRISGWIWLLPGIEILWVNCHGPFVLGPLLVCAWLVEEIILRLRGDCGSTRRLRWAASMVIITAAAAMLNPYTYRAYALPALQWRWLHGTQYKDFIGELHSPFAFGAQYTALWYFAALVVLTIASALLNLRRLQVFWLLIIGSQLYLALTAIRNVPLFCLAAVPFVVMNLQDSPALQRMWRHPSMPVIRLTGAMIIVGFCIMQFQQHVTNRAWIRQNDTNQFGIGVAEHRFATGAAKFIESSGIAGRIFNTIGTGSALIAQGIPVFIGPHVQENIPAILPEYLEVLHDSAAFDEATRQYGLEAFVIETDRLDVIGRMLAHPRWRLVHADSEAVVFFRDDAAGHVPTLDLAHHGDEWFASVEKSMWQPVAYATAGVLTALDSPIPYNRLAGFCMFVSRYELAERLYEWSLSAYPSGFTEYDALAFCKASRNDHQAAAMLYQEAINRAQRTPSAVDAGERRVLRLRLAASQLQLGRAAQARQVVEQQVRESPDDAQAVSMMGLIELVDRRGPQAEQWLRKALVLQPDDASSRKNLAQALFLQGKTDEAVTEFEASWRLNPGDFAVARDVAMLLAQVGRLDDARTWLDRAADIRPDDPTVAQMRQRLEAPATQPH